MVTVQQTYPVFGLETNDDIRVRIDLGALFS